MRSTWSFVALLVAALSLGCGEDAPAPSDPEQRPPQAERDDEPEEADAGTQTTRADAGRRNDRSPPRVDASPEQADASARRDAAASPREGGAAVEAGDDAGDTMEEPTDVGDGGAGAGPKLPPVTSTAMDGPFRTMQDLRSGPARKSGLFRPSELGQGGVKHPVFVWGCGGGSTPMSYADQLSRVASHGFVVIAEAAAIGDNGAPLRAAIDWIVAENERAESPLRGMLDTSKIALGGHSIGSANSFYIADDPRLTTTIHVAGGSLDNVRDPFAPTTGMGGKRLVHPVAYICSMSDTFGNVEKTQKDYDNTSVPAWMTVMTGVEHVGAARNGLPAIIAWLRWHLAGERERRADFLDPGGEFTTGIFVSRSKNW